MLGKLRTRLHALLRKSEVERELDEELRYHIEQQAEQNVRLGMSPEEARRAALKSFGGMEQAKERSRDARGVRWLEELWQDWRYGARMLARNPSFTLIAVITLALGIGVNTVIFSVVNAVLLRPLPYRDPDRLMVIRETKLPENDDSQVSPGNFLTWQKQSAMFAPLEAITVKDFNLVSADNPERVRGMLATHGFLPMLGMRPLIGRDFLPEEDRPGHDRVVILGNWLWQRRFGGDPNILGLAITLDDQSYTVIGVMPPNSGLRFRDTDVWTPLAITAEQAQQHGSRYLMACGRLKQGVTLEEARLEMSLIANNLAKQYPDSNAGWNVKVFSLLDYAAEWAKPRLILMLGAVAFVLLIACANVANLLMARAAARRREFAIRAALGAGRWRIVRQLLTESLLLSLAGGIAGAAVASWGVKLLLATSVMNEFKLRVLDVSLDGRMLVFNLAVVLLTGCVVGIVPALQASKPNLNETLNEGGRGSTGGRRQQLTRDTLVAIEVAMSLVLLVGAGLMIRSFIGLRLVDPGFNPRNVRTISFSLPKEKYPQKERQAAFYAQLIEKVASLPGVQVAGAACAVPFSEGHWGDFEVGFKITNQSFKIEGRAPYQAGHEPPSDYSSVSPDYFKAIGIPLLRGRYFTERDTKGASRVAIINNTMAKKFFPDEDPIGKRIHLTGGLTSGGEVYREIVGVVGDVKYYVLNQETPAQIYEPYLQQPFPFMTLVLRADGDPAGLNEAIRAEILKLDREQPVVSINMLDRLVSASTAEQQSLGLLFGTFAAVAVGLAAVGLYGVMSYAVTRRTQEIGVRMALGARRLDVLVLILRHGARLTLCGVAVGLLTAWAVTRLLASELYGVGATDPLTFIGVPLLLIGVALLACYIPARRATKVDPLVALRCD
jgi:putative ABC transport system permease protein